jgi:hypothetical protein
MAGITLVQAQALLDSHLAALEKVLKGQKVEMDGKSLTRADITALQAGVDKWEARVNLLTRADKLRVMRVVPL